MSQSAKAIRINNQNDFANLAEVTRQIMNSVNGRTGTTVNLISIGKVEFNRKVEDFKGDFLFKNFETSKATFCQESVGDIEQVFKYRRHFSIFVAVNVENFTKIFYKIKKEYFMFNGFFIIVLVGEKIEEVSEIFKIMWNIEIFNVNVIYVDNDGVVIVKTFFPFNKTSCNDTSSTIINKFEGGKFDNELDQIFPDKLKDHFNCSIPVAIASKGSEPFIILNKSLNFNSSYILTGRDIRLVQTLARSLNFSIDYVFVETKGNLYENGSSTGLWKTLAEGKADFSPANSGLKTSRLKFFDATTPYADNQDVFIIPPPQDLTAFEKLLRPFTNPSWVLILSCFLVGVAIIFTTKQLSSRFQNVIFGERVNFPYLNMFNILIGGVQPVLPRTTFARFLLIIFFFYSLIIRTLYQGSFYRILQSNIRHKEIQSFVEMVEKEFNFYGTSSVRDSFMEAGVLEKR